MLLSRCSAFPSFKRSKIERSSALIKSNCRGKQDIQPRDPFCGHLNARSRLYALHKFFVIAESCRIRRVLNSECVEKAVAWTRGRRRSFIFFMIFFYFAKDEKFRIFNLFLDWHSIQSFHFTSVLLFNKYRRGKNYFELFKDLSWKLDIFYSMRKICKFYLIVSIRWIFWRVRFDLPFKFASLVYFIDRIFSIVYVIPHPLMPRFTRV